MLLSQKARTNFQQPLLSRRSLVILIGGTLFLIIEIQGYSSPMILGNQPYRIAALGTLLTLVARYGLRDQREQRHAQAAAETYAQDLAQLDHALRCQQQEFEATQRLLTQRYEALQHKLITIGELGVGVVPLAPGVLVVPLHGDTTLTAAHAVRARLLAAYTLQEAHTLVLDVQCTTCRPRVARVLAQTLESIANLGVRVIVCGSSELLCPLAPAVERLADLRGVLANFAS